MYILSSFTFIINIWHSRHWSYVLTWPIYCCWMHACHWSVYYASVVYWASPLCWGFFPSSGLQCALWVLPSSPYIFLCSGGSGGCPSVHRHHVSCIVRVTPVMAPPLWHTGYQLRAPDEEVWCQSLSIDWAQVRTPSLLGCTHVVLVACIYTFQIGTGCSHGWSPFGISYGSVVGPVVLYGCSIEVRAPWWIFTILFWLSCFLSHFIYFFPNHLEFFSLILLTF